MEKSQPLRRNLLGEKTDPGGVAVRPGKTGDKTKRDRVSAAAEDDRDRCGGRFGCLNSSGRAGRSDNGDATADEVNNQRRYAIVSAVQPMVLDHHVLPLDEAGFVKALAECSEMARGSIGQPTADKADDRHRRLLRPVRKRPRRLRAAEQRDELAPLHSITSSARSRNESGIVRPSPLAVVRLMTSSNLDGCSTGISPGFVPRRILSTSSAVRRNRSEKFGP